MIYLMSYMTASSYEAEVDDPSRPGRDLSMEDMASPQVARAATNFSDAWLERCKKEVEDDELEVMGGPGDRDWEVEEKLRSRWLASRRPVESGWTYEPIGLIQIAQDGKFLVPGDESLHDTLAKAERHLFDGVVLDTLERPEPEPIVFTWRTDGWVEEPQYGRPHQVFTMHRGDELAATMVIQRIAPDDEAYQ